MLEMAPPVLRLSNELLDLVAAHVGPPLDETTFYAVRRYDLFRDSSANLRSMALTCTQLRASAQQQLFQTPFLLPHMLARFIRTLSTDRTDLAPKVRKLRIRLSGPVCTGAESPVTTAHLSDSETFSRCKQLAQASPFSPERKRKWLTELDEACAPAYAGVALTLLPNLTLLWIFLSDNPAFETAPRISESGLAGIASLFGDCLPGIQGEDNGQTEPLRLQGLDGVDGLARLSELELSTHALIVVFRSLDLPVVEQLRLGLDDE